MKAFVKKPSLSVHDLVTFDDGIEHAGRIGMIEVLSLKRGTLADVRLLDTGELLTDVRGEDITKAESVELPFASES